MTLMGRREVTRSLWCGAWHRRRCTVSDSARGLADAGSTHAGRIEYIVGDSGGCTLLFRATRHSRAERLNSLAVGSETVEHLIDCPRKSRELVVRHYGAWH